ncbi:MAG: TIGR02757 family protein [Desulfarculaceae bacterium]|nr:TIGR02757 family protein [Desulfarculaceae bacterium]
MTPGNSDFRRRLEEIRRIYNKRRFVRPDPLQFLYEYPDIDDREICGMMASSLAFGRVDQILKAVDRVLSVMGKHPRRYIETGAFSDFDHDFGNFYYRFVKGRQLAELCKGLKHVIQIFGSLNECFLEGFSDNHETILPALSFMTSRIREYSDPGYLLALPEKGSACKRSNLYLRWMVRKDEVDPGGWTGVAPSMLLVPLDTHMHRICRQLGFTDRRQADMNAALQATRSLRKIAPDDPVRYDFPLTRFGIHPDFDRESLVDMFPYQS